MSFDYGNLAKVSDEDLLDEFGAESWAADRCVGAAEHEDSARCLSVLKAEILLRMAKSLVTKL